MGREREVSELFVRLSDTLVSGYDIADFLQSQDGPCYDAYRTREQVVVEDLEACRERWPEFVPKALDLGFRSGHAFPLRLRGKAIGALNLYSETSAPFTEGDVHLAQSLADVATIGIVNERTIRDARTLSEQLQEALDSRVIIEQAKGVLAERHGVSPGEAFERIRAHSRSRNTRLRDVSRRIVHEGFVPD